jgi:thioredoxin 1
MSHTLVHVACLCAAWCRLCDDYAPVLDQVLAELVATGATVRKHWVDIEDEAALVGEFDVETFPTLVVFDATQVRFAGALEPQPDILRRLLRALFSDAQAHAGAAALAPEVLTFVERLRARAETARPPG